MWAMDGGTKGRNMKKQRKQGELVIKDRNFKIGEVFRWVPSYASQEDVEARGFGIVVKADGPSFEAYWTGDGKVRKHDLTLERNTCILQDYAPIPQVAETIEELQREYL